jgi:phage terminase large subunit GpA-like protein
VVTSPTKALAAALRPPEQLWVDEWGERYRYISREEGCAEYGQLRLDRTPYLREIARKLDPKDPTRRIVVRKGVQIGATEVANLWIGYIIDRAPAPILVVQSTQELQQRWAGTRLARMIETTPALADKVGRLGKGIDGRRKRGPESAMTKSFPGGYLVVGISTSKSSLAQLPAQYLVLDEIDRYPLHLPGEGSPIAIAEKRTTTYAETSKVYLCSTPTLKGYSPIDDEWQLSDKRHWMCACPECGQRQRMVWRQVRWSELGRKPADACYQCEHCDALIEEHQRADFVLSGRWEPTQESDVAGYHIPGLLSTLGLTLGVMAEEFVKAKEAGTEQLQVFINTRLGEPWEERDAGRMDASVLMQRRHAWWQPSKEEVGVPTGVWLLTAGVDVQASPPRIEVEVFGWGRGEEHWSIDLRLFHGDPMGDQVWQDLDHYLGTEFPCEEGGTMGIEATCVDTGYGAARVYQFVRQQSRRRRVWAVKGRSAVKQRTQRPLWPRKPTKLKKCDLHILNVDTAKDQIYAWLRVGHPGPGFPHHDFRRDQAYFDQLTAEHRVTEYVGGFPVLVWRKPKKAANEALDMRVYGLAALHGIYSYGRTLESFGPSKPEPRRQVRVDGVPKDLAREKGQSGRQDRRKKWHTRRPRRGRDLWPSRRRD